MPLVEEETFASKRTTTSDVIGGGSSFCLKKYQQPPDIIEVVSNFYLKVTYNNQWCHWWRRKKLLPQKVPTTTSDVIGGGSSFCLKKYQWQPVTSLSDEATFASKSTDMNQWCQWWRKQLLPQKVPRATSDVIGGGRSLPKWRIFQVLNSRVGCCYKQTLY